MDLKRSILFMIRHSKIVLLCLGMLLVLAAANIHKVKPEFNFQDFLIKNDPDLKFYQDFKKKFEVDNEVLLIGIFRPPSVFQKSFLQELNSFTNKCNELDQVDRAYSLTSMKDYIRSPLGILPVPLIHLENPAGYSEDSMKIMNDERFVGWLISKDSKTATVIVNSRNGIDEKLQRNLISSLDSLISLYSFDEVHIAGNMNTEVRHLRQIGHELTINTILCSLIIIIFLLFVFRAVKRIIIPSVTVISAMLIFYGGLGLFHQNINILSALFPTILLIVGISDIIHFLTRYHHFLGENMFRDDAITTTLEELFVAMLITSLTTAFGFFSLITSPIQPIKNFGIQAGTAVMLTFIIAILFIPAVLKNIKPERYALEVRNTGRWDSIFSRIVMITREHQGKIYLITAILIAASLIGIARIDTNNRIVDNFSAESKVKKDFMFFEQHLSGVRSLKMAVMPKGDLIMEDLEVLKQIEKMHQYLQSIPEVGIVFSPATVYKTMHKIFRGGGNKEYRLPEELNDLNQFSTFFRSAYNNDIQLISKEGHEGMITAQIKDVGSRKMELINKQTEEWIAKNIDSKIVKFRQTGISFLYDKSNNSLMRNMIFSLIFAFVLVSILMSFLFKNIKLLIISLIPNFLPLVIAGGVMGFSGLVYNATTAVVFTIGFVIAVDNTIHFLSRFRMEQKSSPDMTEAIRTTFHKTGKAIILTSIILIFGFLVLLRSELKGIFIQGVLLCTISFSALFGDIILLPVLIYKFYKKGIS